MINLFVLDDDPVFHRLVELSLSRSRAFKNVYHHYDSYVLLNYIADNRDDFKNLPDVILVDLNMPLMDGWGFMNSLQKLYNVGLGKKMDIYIVTVSVIPADRIKALNYPFVKEFITKPITTAKLTEIAKTHFENTGAK